MKHGYYLQAFDETGRHVQCQNNRGFHLCPDGINIGLPLYDTLEDAEYALSGCTPWFIDHFQVTIVSTFPAGLLV